MSVLRFFLFLSIVTDRNSWHTDRRSCVICQFQTPVNLIRANGIELEANLSDCHQRAPIVVAIEETRIRCQ